MKNVKSNSASFDAAFVKLLSKAAPLLILLGMCLCFLFLGVIQHRYYDVYLLSSFFESDATVFFLAVMLAIIFQLVRFAFGVSSADEFAEGDHKRGWLGLIFSVGLTVFEWFEIVEITHYWVSNTGVSFLALYIVLQCVSMLALALELRLIVNIAKDGNYSFSLLSRKNKQAKNQLIRDAWSSSRDNAESTHELNTKRRDKLLNLSKVRTAIDEYFAENRENPSIKKVAEQTGLSRKTVSNYYHEVVSS